MFGLRPWYKEFYKRVKETINVISEESLDNPTQTVNVLYLAEWNTNNDWGMT